MENPTNLAFSIDQIVAISSVGRTKVYEAIARGDLVARKAGRRTIVLYADAQNWLQGLPHVGNGAKNSKP